MREHLPTDDWTEKYFKHLAADIESLLKMFTEADAESIYSVRRHTMQCLRHGYTNMGELIETNRILRRKLIKISKDKRNEAR